MVIDQAQQYKEKDGGNEACSDSELLSAECLAELPVWRSNVPGCGGSPIAAGHSE